MRLRPALQHPVMTTGTHAVEVHTSAPRSPTAQPGGRDQPSPTRQLQNQMMASPSRPQDELHPKPDSGGAADDGERRAAVLGALAPAAVPHAPVQPPAAELEGEMPATSRLYPASEQDVGDRVALPDSAAGGSQPSTSTPVTATSISTHHSQYQESQQLLSQPAGVTAGTTSPSSSAAVVARVAQQVCVASTSSPAAGDCVQLQSPAASPERSSAQGAVLLGAGSKPHTGPLLLVVTQPPVPAICHPCSASIATADPCTPTTAASAAVTSDVMTGATADPTQRTPPATPRPYHLSVTLPEDMTGARTAAAGVRQLPLQALGDALAAAASTGELGVGVGVGTDTGSLTQSGQEDGVLLGLGLHVFPGMNIGEGIPEAAGHVGSVYASREVGGEMGASGHVGAGAVLRRSAATIFTTPASPSSPAAQRAALRVAGGGGGSAFSSPKAAYAAPPPPPPALNEIIRSGVAAVDGGPVAIQSNPLRDTQPPQQQQQRLLVAQAEQPARVAVAAAVVAAAPSQTQACVVSAAANGVATDGCSFRNASSEKEGAAGQVASGEVRGVTGRKAVDEGASTSNTDRQVGGEGEATSSTGERVVEQEEEGEDFQSLLAHVRQLSVLRKALRAEFQALGQSQVADALANSLQHTLTVPPAAAAVAPQPQHPPAPAPPQQLLPPPQHQQALPKQPQQPQPQPQQQAPVPQPQRTLPQQPLPPVRHPAPLLQWQVPALTPPHPTAAVAPQPTAQPPPQPPPLSQPQHAGNTHVVSVAVSPPPQLPPPLQHSNPLFGAAGSWDGSQGNATLPHRAAVTPPQAPAVPAPHVTPLPGASVPAPHDTTLRTPPSHTHYSDHHSATASSSVPAIAPGTQHSSHHPPPPLVMLTPALATKQPPGVPPAGLSPGNPTPTCTPMQLPEATPQPDSQEGHVTLQPASSQTQTHLVASLSPSSSPFGALTTGGTGLQQQQQQVVGVVRHAAVPAASHPILHTPNPVTHTADVLPAIRWVIPVKQGTAAATHTPTLLPTSQQAAPAIQSHQHQQLMQQQQQQGSYSAKLNPPPPPPRQPHPDKPRAPSSTRQRPAAAAAQEPPQQQQQQPSQPALLQPAVERPQVLEGSYVQVGSQRPMSG